MSTSAVETANDFVPMSVILSWTGVYVPDTEFGKSWKTVCPFGEMYHINGATDKCLRYYQASNSAYCFQGCGYLSPVNVYSAMTGLGIVEAAEELLLKFNYQDATDEEKWKEALRLKLQIDPAYLKDALQTYCNRLVGDSWVTLQYENYILKALTRCFELLKFVKSPEQATAWLTACKGHMLGVIENAS